MRVAIAHDYLTQLGGAERVVLSLTRAFPGAPVYTTLYNPATTFPEFRDVDVRVSPLNRVGAFRANHRAALPLLPFASRSIRIDADVVVASSSGWAHGFTTNGKLLVYCHSPARWLYLRDDYLGDGAGTLKRVVLNALTPALRRWDQRAAMKADCYLANSQIVRDRIKEVYGIDAKVLHPPYTVEVDGDREQPAELAERGWDSFHLLVSRLMPYKNVDQALAAFADLPRERLVIVGHGPLAEQLRASAPSNVVFLQHISDEQLHWLYAHATALIAPSHEDFGLTVPEAGAFGTPALALRSGGYLDTIDEEVNGLFFDHPTAPAIGDAVRRYRSGDAFDPSTVADRADAFSEESFVAQIRAAVADLMHDE